jgi:hypothetical protein
MGGLRSVYPGDFIGIRRLLHAIPDNYLLGTGFGCSPLDGAVGARAVHHSQFGLGESGKSVSRRYIILRASTQSVKIHFSSPTA